MSAILVLTLAVLGCGARSGLLDDERADAGRPARADAAAMPETCVAGEPFEVLRTTGPLTHPRLASTGSAAMLVVTRGERSEAPRLLSLPIVLRGRARGEPREIGAGFGGTLLGETLDTMGAPAFTLSFSDGAGELAGSRLDLDGRLMASSSLGVESGTDRPLLVIMPALVANGWSVVGSPAGLGFVQDLRTFEMTDLVFEGSDPHGMPASVEHFHAVSHFGSRTIIETIDSHGGGPPSREIELTDFTDTEFPVGVQFTRIADGPDDTLFIGGGTIRAIYDAIIHLQLGGEEHTWFFENDLLFDGDVAFDSLSHWMGAAAAILHDEGIAPPTPHIFFFGLKASGDIAEIVLASGIALESVHPAILRTGLPDAEFLVVWEASADTLDGALVDCGTI